MNFDWRPIQNFFQRMSSRERALMGAAVATACILGFYTLVWEPLTENRVRAERLIESRQDDVAEIKRMRLEYMELLTRLEVSRNIIDTKNIDSDFSLFPHIESTVSAVLGGREKIRSMSPKTKAINDAYREEAVELRLDGITLDQLVDMMVRIEKGKHPLRVTRLQIKKRRRDTQQFDVMATVSMLKANQEVAVAPRQ
jgi:general secretion pathway protein M